MREIKVGTRVEILNGTKQKSWDSCGYMKKYIGTIGVIIEKTGAAYGVKMDLDGDTWYFQDEDLKIVRKGKGVK